MKICENKIKIFFYLNKTKRNQLYKFVKKKHFNNKRINYIKKLENNFLLFIKP